MIRGRTIVCIASNWFDHPTSKQHVMRRLSAANDVVWVNFHASRRPSLNRADLARIGRRLRQICAGPVRVLPRVRVLTPPLLPWPGVRAVRWLNARVLAAHIRRALRALPSGSLSFDRGAASGPVQLWLFAPDVPELIELLTPERVVYYCVDDFSAFTGYDAALMRSLEQRTIARSDIVLTTSRKLFEERARSHACVHYVPHGVDFEHFAAAPTMPEAAIPADLRRIPRPRLGYMGLISDYLDIELIAAAADARPEWSFVFLGDITCDVSVLRRRTNVHLLGGRAYESLPAYCRGIDVGLIPFRMNRLVRAVNPIKLREYLAAGLPVVSAPMDAVLPYAPAVHAAVDLEEFLKGCAQALAAAGQPPAVAAAERQALVRGESWAARVEDISGLVMDLPATDPAQFEELHGGAQRGGRVCLPPAPQEASPHASQGHAPCAHPGPTPSHGLCSPFRVR